MAQFRLDRRGAPLVAITPRADLHFSSIFPANSQRCSVVFARPPVVPGAAAVGAVGGSERGAAQRGSERLRKGAG